MIFNMIGKGSGGGGVETEGMYCWAKSRKTIVYPELTATGITLTPNGNGFNITSSSGNAWASHLIHSPALSTEGKDINVIHTIASNAYPYFIGFSGAAETVHTAFDHCVYIVNGGTIQHIASNTVAGTYGTYVVGDTIRVNLKDGKFSAYKNEILLFSVDYAVPSAVLNATFHYGSVNYGTIECSSVEETDKSYVLSDDLNAYPQDGHHTDGYYYKLLENNIAWDERGQYAWSKNETVYADGEVSFPTITSATLAATTNGYTLKSGSSGGWGYTYLNSDPIDTKSNPITLKYTIASTGLLKGIFIGVADTKTTTYSNLDHSIYLSTGATNICHWRNGSQINAYETTTTNDVITMTVNGTLMSVYKNDKLIFTDTLAFTNAYVCIVLYTANTVYGVIDCKMANIPSYTPIGYVIGSTEDAYPNDGSADDGYYYVKVGATKVNPKYASGTVNAVAAKVTVTGLGFKPYAVMLQYSTAAIGYGVLDGASGTITAYSKISSNNNTAATFVSNDDGFEFTGANWSTYPFNWYAIGY